MKIVIGLGNPGKKFERTRHNVGFRTIDEIAANFQLPSNSAKVKKKESSSTAIFNFQSIFNAQISKGKINNQEIILAKPQTFMNESGKAVKLLTKSYTLNANDLIVIHDDFDLPLGKLRISKGRSSAGHKGVESIIRELGTKNFVRFRIGIKSKKGDEDKSSSSPTELPFMEEKVKMETKSPSPFAIARVIEDRKQKIEDFVLKKFNKDEEKILKEAIEKTVEAIEITIKEGVEKAMSEYNK